MNSSIDIINQCWLIIGIVYIIDDSIDYIYVAIIDNADVNDDVLVCIWLNIDVTK